MQIFQKLCRKYKEFFVTLHRQIGKIVPLWRFFNKMRKILTFIIVCLTVSVIYSCGDDSKIAVEDDTLSGNIPGMVTRDVSMQVSDSGIIRYLATAPLWKNYSLDASNRYQYFPEGIHIVMVDSLLNPEASIVADTAYNYESKQLWHLINDVVIENLQNEKFMTNDLFWDMRRHRVYSDSFIHIERPDAIIEGIGFTSTDDFTEYTLRETSGIFSRENADTLNRTPSEP